MSAPTNDFNWSQYEAEFDGDASSEEFEVHPNGKGLVAKTARVDSGAFVGPNARIMGHARVFDRARIMGTSVITDNAVVFAEAQIMDAHIGGRTAIGGTVRVGKTMVVSQALGMYNGNQCIGDFTL